MHEAIIVIAKYAVALPALVYLWLLFMRRKDARGLLLFTIASVLLAVLFTKIATSIHTDARPFVRDGVKPFFASSTDNGFPSDHTVFASLLALIVLRYKRPYGVALLVLAVLIGWARVASNVHHAQDVVAGLVISAVSAGLGWLIARRLTKSVTVSK